MADETRVRERAAEAEVASAERRPVRGAAGAARWRSGSGSSTSTSTQFAIDPELFRSIPVDLMFRYNFVPRRRTERGLSRSSSPTRPTC